MFYVRAVHYFTQKTEFKTDLVQVKTRPGATTDDIIY